MDHRMINWTDQSLVRQIDSALSSAKPFGDSDYIHEQLHFCYGRRLRSIAKDIPSAEKLAEQLGVAKFDQVHEVLGDPVVRCALHHASRQTATGEPYGLAREKCDLLFQSALDRLGDPQCSNALSHALSLPFRSTHFGVLQIWQNWHEGSLFSDAFRDIIDQTYGEYGSFKAPSPEDIRCIDQSLRILNDLLPRASRSALRHVHLIVLFEPEGAWSKKGSGSAWRLNGAIFLNRELVSNPWWLAEHILHEALHQKFYDFRHGHTMMNADLLEPAEVVAREVMDDGAPTTKVLSPWNSPGTGGKNYWDTSRVFAAFHVYVHLGLFGLIAEAEVDQDPEKYGAGAEAFSQMTTARNALDRAKYLGESILTMCLDDLGPAGVKFVEWLNSVLEFIDTAPPPRAATTHLYLDRYAVEARRVKNRDTNTDQQLRTLDGLVRLELETMHRILVEVGGAEDNNSEKLATELFDHLSPGERFCEARRLIVGQLQAASVDGYTLTSNGRGGDQSADDAVRAMVESSSAILASSDILS